MENIFLEGLQTAREIIVKDGLKKLDDLIAEHESGTIERAVPSVEVESR